MFRRKAEKRMVELSPNEARMMREALLAFVTSFYLPENRQRM